MVSGQRPLPRFAAVNPLAHYGGQVKDDEEHIF